jgi:fatty-acyl-CoA synthase
MLLFTGGTTGTLKAAVIPYRQDLANAASTIVSWNLEGGDCVIQAPPMFHAAVNAFTLPLLHLGARVAIQRSFDPAAHLQMVRECGATILFLVPTMYKLLVQHPDFAAADFSGIRWAISGGAACPPDVVEAFRARGVRFKQGYGLTEAGPNCFSTELDDAAARPQSIGKPILYTEAVLRDKNGHPVPRGDIGELTLAGPHLASGYFERPAETAEAFRDGWLWTGDLARQDDQGFFYIAGRCKEMFISGGENVFPSEIEACLHQHPAIADCAVAGVADADWGEVGLAAIVLRPGQHTSADELREYLRGSLARYKVPKHFRFVEIIPKSGAGKVLRRDVARTL